MSVTLLPSQFAPSPGRTPEERIALALEFLAERMSMIEYNTTLIRMEIMKLAPGLGAMVPQPPMRRGGP